MLAFDTSSIIYAWDTYPKNQFPPLWRWLEGQISAQQIVMSKVAFEEIAIVARECAEFLKDAEIPLCRVTNQILSEAVEMKRILRIKDDKYGSGVDENDLLIISTAKVHGVVFSCPTKVRNPYSRARIAI